MKEEFMQEMYNEQERIQSGFDIDHELKEHEYNNNQINNNQMSNNLTKVKTKKTMENKVEVKEVKEETRKEALRRLYKENNLTKEDIFKSPMGFVIITRTGIDKIVSNNNIQVAYDVITMDIDAGIVVVKAVASMTGKDGKVRNRMSFGETNKTNYVEKKTRAGNIVPQYPVAMAEKRAMSRVVLKISGFYEQGVFGQDEIVDVDKE